MPGIKETVELVEGLGELTRAAAAALKDGFQPVDIFDLLKKALDDKTELGDKLLKAFEGVAAVPGELADIDIFEGVRLVKEVSEEL